MCTGCGVNNCPVGLAAYILEKFTTWTNMKNRDLVDGGLERYIVIIFSMEIISTRFV